jgi:hypothetical protein
MRPATHVVSLVLVVPEWYWLRLSDPTAHDEDKLDGLKMVMQYDCAQWVAGCPAPVAVEFELDEGDTTGGA